MARRKGVKSDNGRDSGNHFQFNLIGLIIFSLCLVAGTGLIVGKFFGGHQPKPVPTAVTDPDQMGTNVTSVSGPWGELLIQDIELERPVELITAAETSPGPEIWTFHNMDAAQVKALFVTSGLTGGEAEAALSPDRVSSQGGDTTFQPGDDFVFSLSQAKRQQLYAALYGRDVNLYLDYPYIFSTDSLDSIYTDTRLDPDDVALLKKLVYPEDGEMRLSDVKILMSKIPTTPRRVAMTQALSRERTIIARLCICRNTDIDKMVSYWGRVPNVRINNTRPLLESLKALPNGGTINLIYMLPPFAREHLYTYPELDATNPAVMDCHWTTFNFDNLKPDNGFSNVNYTIHYIEQNYYQVSTPAVCGDIVLLMNDKNQILHSAVYLASDLVFTKYGNNNAQPWIIAHMSDMEAIYPNLKAYYMRRNSY